MPTRVEYSPFPSGESVFFSLHHCLTLPILISWGAIVFVEIPECGMSCVAYCSSCLLIIEFHCGQHHSFFFARWESRCSCFAVASSIFHVSEQRFDKYFQPLRFFRYRFQSDVHANRPVQFIFRFVIVHVNPLMIPWFNIFARIFPCSR